MPAVRARYRTTDETAIVGESLAGLFVVETFLVEPELFDTYIAFDPSLWWNGGKLLERASAESPQASARTLYLASSSEEEISGLTARLAELVANRPASGWTVHHEAMPEESHATIYHPAALRAFRRVFALRQASE